MIVIKQLWLPLLLCCAATLALPLPEEHDSAESRKVLGSSVVTSVSVVMENENGTKTAYFTDAVGKPVEQPKEGGEIGSPVDLITPDKYQFYTFDGSGNLVTRYMTRDEVKSIIANGQKSTEMQQESPTFYHNLPANADELTVQPTKDDAVDTLSQSQMKMHSVVASVQNVLKGHLEETLLEHLEPTGSLPSTPDTASSWSLILPSYLGNNDATDSTEIPSTTENDIPVSLTTNKITSNKPSETASSESVLMADAPANPSAEYDADESTSSSESEESSSETDKTEANIGDSSSTTEPPTKSSDISTSVTSVVTHTSTKSTEIKNKTLHQSQASQSAEHDSNERPLILVPLIDTPVNPNLTSTEEANLEHLVETISTEKTHVTIPSQHSSTEEEISDTVEVTYSTEPTLSSSEDSSEPESSEITTSIYADKVASSASADEGATFDSDEVTHLDSSVMGDAPHQQDTVHTAESNEDNSDEDKSANPINSDNSTEDDTTETTKSTPTLSTLIWYKLKEPESAESLVDSNEQPGGSDSLSLDTDKNVSTPDTVSATASKEEKLPVDNKKGIPSTVTEILISQKVPSKSSEEVITLYKNNNNIKTAASGEIKGVNHTTNETHTATQVPDVDGVTRESSHSTLEEIDGLLSTTDTTFIKLDEDSSVKHSINNSESDDSDINNLNVSNDLSEAITQVLREVTQQAVLESIEEDVEENFIKVSSSTDIPNPSLGTSSETVTEDTDAETGQDEKKPNDVVVVSVSSSQTSQSSSSSVSSEQSENKNKQVPNRNAAEVSEQHSDKTNHNKTEGQVLESEIIVDDPEGLVKVKVPVLHSQSQDKNSLKETQPSEHHKGHKDAIDVDVEELFKLTENKTDVASPLKPGLKLTATVKSPMPTITSTKEKPADEVDLDVHTPSNSEVVAVESKDPVVASYEQVPLKEHNANNNHKDDLVDKNLEDFGTTVVYDGMTQRTSTTANQLVDESIDISNEVTEVIAKKDEVVETEEGSGEGSGTVPSDNEDTTEETGSGSQDKDDVDEGSGSGATDKFDNRNSYRETTTGGYSNDKHYVQITTLGHESGEISATEEPYDSNDNKISNEKSSYSGSGDESNSEASDTEKETSSTEINSSGKSPMNVWEYINSSKDVGIKATSQSEQSGSENSESTENNADPASMYDVNKYILSDKDYGIVQTSNMDESGNVKSDSTEHATNSQSTENSIVVSSSSTDNDAGSTITSEIDAAASEANDSNLQNDANASPENIFDVNVYANSHKDVGVKPTSHSENSETDKSEEIDASLSQSIYDLNKYIHSDKDIGIKTPLNSEGLESDKSGQNDVSLSQSLYDLNKYINSDKDIGIKTHENSDESESEKSEINNGSLSSENVSNANNDKNVKDTTNTNSEKSESVENNPKDDLSEQNLSTVNKVLSSESESSEESHQETTTSFDVDQEMNDQRPIDSSEHTTDKNIDTKPQTTVLTQEEPNEETIKYYKTDINALNQAKPNHKTNSKPPGETSWTKVAVITPVKTNASAEQIHERSPQKPVPSGNQPQSQSAPSIVELHPAPEESLGLEASTVHLFEDVQKFADLCNELAFKMWLSVTSKGVSAARSLVMSPFAMTSMLSMIFLGARGPTSGQMNDVLRLDDMMTFNPHQVFRNVTESLVLEKNPGVSTAAIVRELYSDKSRGKMLDFYKQRATQFYDGHVEEVNFSSIGDTIRRRTNLLVKRQTSGKISEYMQGSNLMLQSPLAAFSANIFQTDCSSASTEGRDGEMYFTILPATRQRRLVPIPAVVYRSGFMAGYEPVLDATVVSLGGHDSSITTLLVLPGQQGQLAPGDGLPRLEDRLLNASYVDGAWSKLLRSLLPRTGLEVQIPRFSHRSQLNLTQSLQSMGLNDLFDPNSSDLKGLSGSGNDLHVSDVIQVNTFSTCGEDVIGSKHHVEIYPGTPLRSSREDNSGEQEETDETPVVRKRQARLDTHQGPSGFEDLVQESIYQMPLALRPRQARIPDEEAQPRLKFDRPFLYFVRHNPTGFILHMGRFNPRLIH